MKISASIILLSTALLTLSPSLFSATEAPTKDAEKKVTQITDEKKAPLSADQQALKKGDQLWSEKKIDEAIKEYKRIIAENPDNKYAYQRVAGVYLLDNKSKKAEEAYKEAILHDPENPKLFASMSIAYLHQSKYSMAKAMASEAVRLDPSLKSAQKILLYTDKKQEVIKQAGKSEQATMAPHGAVIDSKKPAAHTTKMPAHPVTDSK